MPLVSDLLAAPALRGRLQHFGGPDREASSAALCEELDQLGAVSPGAVVILTAGASRAAAGYRLDMALRVAGSHSVAAVAVTDGRVEIPATALTIAERAQVAVLGTPAGVDLAALILAVDRELIGDSDSALSRLAGVLAALGAAEEQALDADGIVTAGSAALGHPLERRPPPNDEPDAEADADDLTIPVLSDGEVVGTVCAARRGGHHDTVTEAAARLVAGALTRAELAARRAEVRSAERELKERLSGIDSIFRTVLRDDEEPA